jgi:hypothetical protein
LTATDVKDPGDKMNRSTPARQTHVQTYAAFAVVLCLLLIGGVGPRVSAADWPIRASVLVDDGVVYCGAGIFPYEGLYICALDAEDGFVIWTNDTIGDRSHELSYGGISPHGYLLASKEVLYVPSGRAMPAGFSRKTGEFLFWASPGGKQGGAWALLDENRLIAGVDRSGSPRKLAYDARTGRGNGDAFAWFPGVDMVLRDNTAYVLTAGGVYAIDRKAHAEAVRQVSRSAEKRKALGKESAQLKKDLEKADAQQARKKRERIDEITRIIADHLAQEKRLQNSRRVQIFVRG